MSLEPEPAEICRDGSRDVRSSSDEPDNLSAGWSVGLSGRLASRGGGGGGGGYDGRR